MDVVNSLLRAARAGNLKRLLEIVEDDLVDINVSNNNGLTALHSACKEGHTRIVEELLARGANVHAKTLKGNQPIHIASLAGHEPVVRILLDNGADVNAQSTSGFTSLYMAAQENHESIVRLLLERGADQNISTTDGFTPLAVSLQQNHENIAKILLNHEARGQVRFPGVTDTGRSLLHVAAKKNDCAAAALLLQNNISPDVTSKSNFTSLHVACHYGNEAVAKLLIDNGADVNFQAKQNITPLHVAARWNQLAMVNLLLDYGARIDAQTKDHLTPLHCAARMGHDACVELLIRRGAPISAKTRSHLVPLHMSAQGNHLRSAQILLNNRAPVDDVTIDHLTSLHVASHCGHVKVAKLLLDYKADPNLRAQNGFTSLHIACKKNHLEIVKLLLKYGASLKAVTESGLSCLHIASFMGCVEIVIYLLDHDAEIEAHTIRGETPLILATRSNQYEVIDVLLRYGANANACDQNHQNALHLSARLGNAKIAKLLIDRGIDIDAPTRQMYTALHIASKENHENVVALLLENGADISCATKNHEFFPLHLASKYGNDKIVELLLNYGAPVDARGKNDVTSLMVASHYDHPRVVELLLMFGASPHATAKNGYTAIHIAAKGNRIDCSNILLQNGADPNVESKAGFCPLHLASQEGRANMAALLLNNGAQVNCRAKNGITPLHLCAQEDHVSVAQLLVKYGAHLDAQTRNGFTPLHVACHFTRVRMIRFLLANGANVNVPAASGYTSLHQASQQGNPQIVDLLLQYNAKPDALTDNGHSALSIAENLGHVSVIDTLRIVTETVIKTTKTTITEEKFKIIAPETMQETFVSDSEDEADDTPAHQESVKFLTTDVMRSFNNTMAEDNYNTSQSNLNADLQQQPPPQQQPQQQQPQQVQLRRQRSHQSNEQLAGGTPRTTRIADEMSQDLQYLSREAPLDGGESTFGAYSTLGGGEMQQQQQQQQQQQHQQQLEELAPDNVDIQRPLQQAGFLVSFMVDARGGAMRGCRHSGVRVIIPPNTAPQPMRITCRYLRRERLVHPPPLMEGEACASKIMEVGPAGARFLGPVLIEVPHFASLRGKEREIIILRSDSGEVWREHLFDTDEQLIDSIIRSAELVEQQNANTGDQENQRPSSAIGQSSEKDGLGGGGGDSNLQQQEKRLTRIVTNEFPQYFAIISRIRQEVHTVGPDGLAVDSQVVPRVQAIFTDGALTKRIKIGLQKKNGSTQASPEPLEASAGDQEAGVAQDRARSPSGGRPGSAQAKRKSRFLACFGASHGSHDFLDQSGTDAEGFASGSNESSSSAGGDSPRQLAKEKLVERRHIIEDLTDSEAESNSLEGDSGKSKFKKRSATGSELVPEDYYIEPEPAFILNVRPKTYGKRLASSSAQTDQKLQVTGFMSTSAKSQNRRGVNLLSAGKRRRNKTQMQIPFHEPTAQQQKSSQQKQQSRLRPKSADLGTTTADSSLESHHADDHDFNHLMKSSLDGPMLADDEDETNQKWRTCTIQTDSDSVNVQYVTISSMADAATTTTATGQDDGYVSGSGELKRAAGDQTSAKTSHKSGLFLPFCASSGAADDEDLDEKTQTSLSVDEQESDVKRDRKRKKTAAKEKKAKKALSSGKSSPSKLDIVLETKADESIATVSDANVEQSEAPVTDSSLVGNQNQAVVQLSGGEEIDDTTTRSISPTSKERKQQLKLEKQEKLKQEKLERQKQKELEDAQAKAAKAQKKLEKEAKKKAEKAEKLAKKVSDAATKQSPSESRAQSPDLAGNTSHNDELNVSENQKQSGVLGVITKTIQSVKFAPSPSKDSINEKSAASQLDGPQIDESIVSNIDTSTDSTRKPSEDQNEPVAVDNEDTSMVHVSIGADSAVLTDQSKSLQELDDENDESGAQQLISFSSEAETIPTSAAPKLSSSSEQTRVLKPILKQQSSSIEEAQPIVSAELKIDEPKSLSSIADELISEATEDAVRAADAFQRAQLSSETSSPTLTTSVSESKKEAAKQFKAEKDKLKADIKSSLKEEKRLTKEAIRSAKQAEEAAKKAEREAKEAKDEAERQAEIAKREAEHALKLIGAQESEQTTKTDDEEVSEQVDKADLKKRAKETEAEAKRLAKVAEDEAKRVAKEAKKQAKEAEAQRLAEEKLKLKAEKKNKKKSGVEPSAPSLDLISSSPDNSHSDLTGEPIVSADESQSIPIEPSRVSSKLEGSGELQLRQSDESEAATKSEQQVAVKDDGAQHDAEVAPIKEQSEDFKSKKDKKVKNKKRRVDGKDGETSSISSAKDESSTTEVVSKSSFLGRLFRLKPKQKHTEADLPQPPASLNLKQNDDEAKQQDQQQMIVSEMYPSDPNNADGEMILEVNLPEDLISETRRSHQVDSQDQSPDEKIASAVTSIVTSTTGQQVAEQTDDQEATLVNLSQMVDDVNDEDDDEATENVLSQANDLTESIGQPLFSDQQQTHDDVVPVQDQYMNESEQLEITDSTKPVTMDVEVEQTRMTSDDPETKVNESAKIGQMIETVSQEAASESIAVPASAVPQVSTSSPAKELVKDEKARKELEAKLEKEAKKRAKEEEKIRKKQEKEDKRKAELEAKKQAKEEKERLKREAKEAKKLAKEAKKNKNKDPEANVASASNLDAESPRKPSDAKPDTVDEDDQQKPTTITTTTITSTSTTTGDASKLNPNIADELDADRVLMSSTGEVPINEETEVERIVEEVVGEDGTVTKTTKTIETKYVTMRQEEVRVAERRDIPIEEWERMQAERAEQQAQPSTSDSEFIERIKRQTPEKEEYVAPPELNEIRATPSYFDPNQMPAEIKPETSEKKAFRKRIKLNQKLIKRAQKLASSESKKARRDQRRAEAEIAVCDEAARQARKELKRAVKEAKCAAKLSEKQHKKMDKLDKKLAKQAKELDKRQKKIDKRMAKEAKKQAKKDEKEAKKAAKLQRAGSSSSKSPSRSSKRSIRVEDIGEPKLLSSSRLSIVQNNPDVELSTEQKELIDAGIRRGSSLTGAEEQPVDVQVDMSLEDSAPLQDDQHQQDLTQEQIEQFVRDGELDVVHTITREIVFEKGVNDGATVESRETTSVLTGPEAEAAAMRMELQEARDEDDEMMIDVVGDGEPEPERADVNQKGEIQMESSSPETNSAEQDKENVTNGNQSPGTPSKKKNKKKNKKQKSKESA